MAHVRPKFPFSKPQHEWDFPVRVPTNRRKPGGDFVLGRGTIRSVISERAITKNLFVVYVFEPDKLPGWCPDPCLALCSFLPDGKTLVAKRPATQADRRQWKVPTFIQSDEWPMCCGRSMTFVGQLDDNEVCMDPPPDAKYWWHDAASFYVFTCPVCLECKAIGQQF